MVRGIRGLTEAAAASPRLRELAGPAYRRVRREIQWRRCGADLRLERADAEGSTTSLSPRTRR